MAFASASCTTSQQAFNKNPSAVSTSALCRTLASTNDVKFQQNLYLELTRRSVTVEQCADMIRKQNQAIAAGVAIAAVGAAVAVCSKNNCGGGGYARPNYYQGADWDEFYNQYGQLVWVCRDIATGQFVDYVNCYGKAQTDWRWPAKYAY
ncbi:hypothetical protein [Mesorhizobium vachelliae]|uniref:hypothetical protein n=1 Tax=Mesorhizobium vachelliae TaxID=3072309 RepID=UPI002A23ABC0|nr:hypothetical protein [Mesorhizobium sp. VK25D]